MKLLDEKGLTTVWAAIKNTFTSKSDADGKYAKTADVNTALAKKVDAVSGKGLSTNDFTAAYKSKLDGIANGANNYTLPLASENTLGGIKTGFTQRATDTSYPVSVDKAGDAWVTIPNLYCTDGMIERLEISDPNTDDTATYYHDGIEVNGSKISFPKESGTFALTSDINSTVFSHPTNGNVYDINYYGMHQVDLLEKPERYDVYNWFNNGEKGSILDIYCSIMSNGARIIVTNEVSLILNNKETNIISATNKHIRLINCGNYILVAEYNTNETAG